MRQRQVLTGVPSASHAPARKSSPKPMCRRRRSACRIASNGSSDGDGETQAEGRGRREGASRVGKSGGDRSAPRRRSGRDRRDARARGAARPRHARAPGAPRANPQARPAARSAPHHSPQCVAWRNAVRSRLAPPQDKTAAARGAARCVGLDEPLHRVLRPLPARRGRCVPRSRSLRLPHPPRPRLAVAARSRRDARGREAVADGARHRRRHADRRKPCHLQSLARAARHQFAHRADDRLRRLRHRRAGVSSAKRCAGCGGAAEKSSGSIR